MRTAATGRRRSSRTPALGEASWVSRRAAAAVLALVLGGLLAAVGVRESGVLRPPPSTLPALPAAAVVVPGVVRTAQPQEVAWVRLRDDYGVTAVVDVVDEARAGSDGLTPVEERAVVSSLGMTYLQLDLPAGQVPSAEQVHALGDVLGAHPPTRDGSGGVLLHDGDGRGSVGTVAAVVRVLSGESWQTTGVELGVGGAVPSGAVGVGLSQLEDALTGLAGADDPYAGVARP